MNSKKGDYPIEPPKVKILQFNFFLKKTSIFY